jgi:hypothetical protein
MTNQEKLDQDAAETFLKEKFPYFSNCYVVGKPAYIAGCSHARAEAEALREENSRLKSEITNLRFNFEMEKRAHDLTVENEEKLEAQLAAAVKALDWWMNIAREKLANHQSQNSSPNSCRSPSG